MKKNKHFILIAAVALISTIILIETNQTKLFQGNIYDDGNKDSIQSTIMKNQAKPDLAAKIKLIAPENEKSDIITNITITNLGPGEISNKTELTYELFINDKEVTAHTLNYLTMPVNDSFEFNYPIPRTIYQYKNTGVIKFQIDSKNDIIEENENNNIVELEYDF